MRRAQQRDAVNQARFYFRREVFTPAASRATSGTATPDISAVPRRCPDASSTIGMANGFDSDQSNGRRKQRVMENCFPPPPLPDEGLVSGSVKEEYDEYTMDEIINGRVNHLNSYLPQTNFAYSACPFFPLLFFFGF
jgi:glutamate--cysteine ligase catalytic subunit